MFKIQEVIYTNSNQSTQGNTETFGRCVLITANGYAADTALLQQYAARHRFAVLMANHGGQTGGWSPAGKSAFWDENGNLVIASSGTGEALVVATRSDTGWNGNIVALG